MLTDLYQLTMAYAYWKSGRHEREAVFHLVFWQNPFKGGLTIACGLEMAIEFLKSFSWDPSDIDYLAGLKGVDSNPLFETPFLDYLKGMTLPAM